MTASRHEHAGHALAGARLAQSLRNSLSWPQRKLFLLVFLWTCICLVVFKTSLLSSSGNLSNLPEGAQAARALGDLGGGGGEEERAARSSGGGGHLAARSAASLKPSLLLLSRQEEPHNAVIQQQLDSRDKFVQLSSKSTPSQLANVILSNADSTQDSEKSSSGHFHLTTSVVANEKEDNNKKKSGRPQVLKATSSQSARPPPKPTSPVAGDQCHYSYPNLFDLQFNNIHWQKLVSQANGELHKHLASQDDDDDDANDDQELQGHNFTITTHGSSKRAQQQQQQQKLHHPGKATYYLYNAYYDDRWRAGLPSVRVLAMIDRVHPPPTNCLLWLKSETPGIARKPLVTRASFVYAWYPKWGNYEDGILQPWIVTCPLPREHARLVPESVSLVDVPAELKPNDDDDDDDRGMQNFPRLLEEEAEAEEENTGASESLDAPPLERGRRDTSEPSAAEIMPPSFSSSSSSSSSLSPSSAIVPSSSSILLPSDHQQQVSSSQASHVTSSSSKSKSMLALQRTKEKKKKRKQKKKYDCNSIKLITNNLPVFNRRPPNGKREKFAVCVKGLDFPFDEPESRISIRLVEWIEMLNLLGAKKIFLYELDVHENISKVLNYYQQRGLVELSPLTLPGNQPNLPEYQHAYLKQKLTSKRQNELIPYNDCLYRNLYSYEYLALLDIDEIIMPLKEGHTSWYDLMNEVEQLSLSEQNYSRASYNVRNVYFFDDLSGPLGTTQANTQAGSSSSLSPSSSSSSSSVPSSSSSAVGQDNRAEFRENSPENNLPLLAPVGKDDDDDGAGANNRHHDSAERGIPHYLHMMSHVYRSKNYTEPGQYVKCFHNTERVVSLHNHFPMNCFGQCTTYSIPLDLAHLQHYRKDCVGPLRQSCKNDFRLFTTRDTTIWRYKQRMIRRTTRVLNHLGLLSGKTTSQEQPQQVG